MQHISTSSLSELPARISYLSSFLELTPSDGEALLVAKPLIAPLIPAVLNAVYSKLLSFDITAQVFVPKNTDYEGEAVKSVQELTLEHPQIALRKDFLKVCVWIRFLTRFKSGSGKGKRKKVLTNIEELPRPTRLSYWPLSHIFILVCLIFLPVWGILREPSFWDLLSPKNNPDSRYWNYMLTSWIGSTLTT